MSVSSQLLGLKYFLDSRHDKQTSNSSISGMQLFCRITLDCVEIGKTNVMAIKRIEINTL